ncbi:MAG: hypothetical protein KDD60_11260, partial [Bdellovibrionales bacterium]|nr:hypothetical protein [Bdellovibrionales bacterium]
DSLLSIEIDYGAKRTFCSTGKTKLERDGVLRSLEPFSPRGFISVCFPEPGEYPLRVYGIHGNSVPSRGTIIVQANREE